MFGEAVEVGVFKIGRNGLRALGRAIAEHTDVNAVPATGGAADEELLFGGIEFRASNDPLPHFAFDVEEQRFGRGVRHQRSICNEGDVGCSGLNVGDDVSGENDDALAGKV